MRAERLPARFDPTLPANAAKLVAVEQLADLAEQAGLSLIHLAIGFVLRHPAVTSAIIGPRTMEHLDSQLGAASGYDPEPGGCRLPAAGVDRSGPASSSGRPLTAVVAGHEGVTGGGRADRWLLPNTRGYRVVAYP
ncbi:aldo/keto reductase [Micromonospora sp. NBC_01699]|uniref:aldo/keto reductase n=1 Tax=Micromonospora sp. NBC_01699 TaxID=2975984 RepID=UPI003FA5BE98